MCLHLPHRLEVAGIVLKELEQTTTAAPKVRRSFVVCPNTTKRISFGILTSMDECDDDLISAYLEGDDASLGILVDRYLPDAYRFALKLTGDPQSAEDVVQDSFIKTWKHIRSFIPGKSFKAWLFSIVRNTAIDLLRKKKDVAFSQYEHADGHNPFLETLADTEPRVDELLARAEDVEYAEQLVHTLNPAYREVLTLRHEYDLTFDEIGTILHRPLHTVKSQYRRATTALKRIAGTAPTT